MAALTIILLAVLALAVIGIGVQPFALGVWNGAQTIAAWPPIARH